VTKSARNGVARASRLDLRLIALLVAGAAMAGVVAALARYDRDGPARCPPGLVAAGPRCCGTGQRLEGSVCGGTATSCSTAQRLVNDRCTVVSELVVVPGGAVHSLIDDWDLQDKAESKQPEAVSTFAIDRFEVTWARWAQCVDAGACDPQRAAETQLPVTAVAPRQAAAFCRWAGGSLPTSQQWLLAARGPSNRRYPWGPFGLVCRRAAYGLQHGPCAEGAEVAGPEVPGSRPDGATPLGVQDLAGNVAEWTMEGIDDDAPRFVARGGSYASVLASELKGLAVEGVTNADPRVGFRCAYPSPAVPGTSVSQ